MVSLIDAGHIDAIRRFKQLYSRYQRSRDLISVGAYVNGSDPLLDQAIAQHPRFERFLQQDIPQQAAYEDSVRELRQIFGLNT